MTEKEIIVEGDSASELPAGVDPGMQAFQNTMDKFLDTARVESVYGQAVLHEDQLILPCAEVLSGFGFGTGYGSGASPEQGEGQPVSSGSGGGGGGRTFSRPVAVIVASPGGVRVEPILDVTKLGLAALTTGMFMFAMLARLRKPGRLIKEFSEVDPV